MNPHILLYRRVNHQVANEPILGKENFRRMFELEFENAEMVYIIENIFEDGEWVILEWRDSGLRGCVFFSCGVIVCCIR